MLIAFLDLVIVFSSQCHITHIFLYHSILVGFTILPLKSAVLIGNYKVNIGGTEKAFEIVTGTEEAVENQITSLPSLVTIN